MQLLIVRHAWAEEAGEAWPDDALRPLAPEGRRRFARMVKKLVRVGFEPELVASSPLVRCRETAELLRRHAPARPEIVELDALAPASDVQEALRWTAGQKVNCVAWVGHAPDVSEMLAELIGGASARVRFAKGACALVRFDGPPDLGGGELCWLATAKLLGC